MRVKMRKVTIRQFHTNMWEEIKDLPVEVTRYNVPLFVVTPIKGDLKKEEPSIPVTIAEEKPVFFKICKTKMCNNYAVEGSDFCVSHKV